MKKLILLIVCSLFILTLTAQDKKDDVKKVTVTNNADGSKTKVVDNGHATKTVVLSKDADGNKTKTVVKKELNPGHEKGDGCKKKCSKEKAKHKCK